MMNLTMVEMMEKSVSIKYIAGKLGKIDTDVSKRLYDTFCSLIENNKIEKKVLVERLFSIEEAKATMVARAEELGFKVKYHDGSYPSPWYIVSKTDKDKVLVLSAFCDDPTKDRYESIIDDDQNVTQILVKATKRSMTSDEFLSEANDSKMTELWTAWQSEYWPKWGTYRSLISNGYSTSCLPGLTVEESQLVDWASMSVKKLTAQKEQLRREGHVMKEFPESISDFMVDSGYDRKVNEDGYQEALANAMALREQLWIRIEAMDPKEYNSYLLTKKVIWRACSCGLSIMGCQMVERKGVKTLSQPVMETLRPGQIVEIMTSLIGKVQDTNEGLKTIGAWSNLGFMKVQADNGLVKKSKATLAMMAGVSLSALNYWAEKCQVDLSDFE